MRQHERREYVTLDGHLVVLAPGEDVKTCPSAPKKSCIFKKVVTYYSH